MILNANEGILYPKNPQIKLKKAETAVEMPAVFTVSHRAWELSKDEYDSLFSRLSSTDAKYVFVLAPLHKGKINPDDKFCIYSYSDCFIQHDLIVKDDEVCSEEFSYEILLPYIKSCFPSAKSTAFYALDNDCHLKDFVAFLKSNYSDCIILVSGTDQCCSMWLEVAL